MIPGFALAVSTKSEEEAIGLLTGQNPESSLAIAQAVIQTLRVEG